MSEEYFCFECETISEDEDECPECGSTYIVEIQETW